MGLLSLLKRKDAGMFVSVFSMSVMMSGPGVGGVRLVDV